MSGGDGASSGPDAATRRYPVRPVVGVGAVVLCPSPEPGAASFRVLLTRRRYEPLAGQWSLPGGAVEVGETLQEGLARELLEETGLLVDVGPVVDVFDRITRDADGRVVYHYVLVDFVCRAVGGRLDPASDVSDARLADPADLGPFDLTPKTRDVIQAALQTTWAGQPAAPAAGLPASVSKPTDAD